MRLRCMCVCVRGRKGGGGGGVGERGKHAFFWPVHWIKS